MAELNEPQTDKRIPDVTPRQIRTALFLTMGLQDADIVASINTLESPTKEITMTEWQYSKAFERDRPVVVTMGAMLGKTPEELDQLWLYAATL